MSVEYEASQPCAIFFGSDGYLVCIIRDPLAANQFVVYEFYLPTYLPLYYWQYSHSCTTKCFEGVWIMEGFSSLSSVSCCAYSAERLENLCHA